MFSVNGEPAALVTKDTVAEAAPLACGVKVKVKVALCPAAIVIGSAGPVSWNSALLTDADVTVTLEPVAVSVAVMFLLWPTITLPNPKLVGETPNVPTAAPVPDKLIAGRVFEALETTETLPVGVPAACGVKLTLNVKLCPALMVKGTVTPLMPYPVPLTVTCEIVIADPPVLLSISDFVLLLPTCTLPKLRLVGFEAIVPAEGAIPVNDTLSDGLDASLVTVSVPVGLPAVVGVNTTLNDLVAPAARVKGNVRPFTL